MGFIIIIIIIVVVVVVVVLKCVEQKCIGAIYNLLLLLLMKNSTVQRVVYAKGTFAIAEHLRAKVQYQTIQHPRTVDQSFQSRIEFLL